MTGAAHRPERGSPETRTAEHQGSKPPTTTSKQAIKSLHAAEQQLLAAQRRNAIERALAAIAIQSQLAASSRRQQLTAHYASKVAALSPTLTKPERDAAIARLRDEEQAALQALDLELRQSAANERSRVLTPLRHHFRAERVGLGQRQRRQRAALSLIIRRPPRRRGSPRTQPTIRRLAERIHQRRVNRSLPRTPH